MLTAQLNINDLPEINELWHHGVKGQQWGVQNGPPYPLDKDGKTALDKQKKANSKKEEYERVSQESARLISESEKHKGKTGRKMLKEGMDLREKAFKLEREIILESGPDVEDFSRAMLDWSAKSDLKFKKDVPEWYDETLFQKAISTKEKESEFFKRYQKSITEIVDDWNNNYSKEGWKKMDNDDPNIFENFMNSSTSSAALNNDISINVNFYKNFPEQMVDDDFFKHSDHLEHHGILGQKWGDQNGPPYPLNTSQKSYSEKKQAKMDKKWIRKNDKKIRRYADSQSREELKAYEKELRKVMPKYNKNGKVNANYATAYSKKMAELYNKAIGDLAVGSGSGSGKVVKFVAARGQMDVFTALADYGYDMSNVKNGVFNSGKIGYKKESVGVDHDERR